MENHLVVSDLNCAHFHFRGYCACAERWFYIRNLSVCFKSLCTNCHASNFNITTRPFLVLLRSVGSKLRTLSCSCPLRMRRSDFSMWFYIRNWSVWFQVSAYQVSCLYPQYNNRTYFWHYAAQLEQIKKKVIVLHIKLFRHYNMYKSTFASLRLVHFKCGKLFRDYSHYKDFA